MSAPPTTLDDVLRSQAATAPDGRVYRFLDDEGGSRLELTYRQLDDRARRVAAALQDHEVVGRHVLVCAGPDEHHVTALFGCFLAGATALPVYPPAPGDDGAMLRSIVRIAEATEAVVLLAPRAVAASLRPHADDLPPLVILEDALQCAPSATPPGSRPDDPAIILFTSGSTGTPKGAVITHRGFVTNMRTLGERCGCDADEVVVTWLPQGHVAGLYTRLLAVVLGAQAVVMPPAAFVSNPLRWLTVLSQVGGTISAAPDFAYGLVAQLLGEQEASTLDLRPWKLAVSGGEPVRARSMDAFFARLAPAGFRSDAFHPYYGLTETLCTSIPQRRPPIRVKASRLGITRGRFEPASEADDALVFYGNGTPLGDDTEVCIVDPSDARLLQPGAIGEIWTRGPGVTPAYLGDEARSDELCRAHRADGEGPFFRTGDLGTLHDGEVIITGRLKELLIIRGKNHYPADIEATVTAAVGHLGLVGLAAFGVRLDDGEEALAVAVETSERTTLLDEGVRAIRLAVARTHGLALARLFVLEPQTIPRTITQKISRHAAAAAAGGPSWTDREVGRARRQAMVDQAAGVDAGLGTLTGPALSSALHALLQQLLEHTEATIDPATAFQRPINELGLSSIDLARLVASLRRRTGHEPPIAAFFDGSTLVDVVERLALRITGESSGEAKSIPWRDEVLGLATDLPDRVPPRRTRGGAVFLTGATGFLGRWLLGELLRQTDRRVVCLVRASDEPAGLERLRGVLRDVADVPPDWEARVDVCIGDFSAPLLGLGKAGWRRLADRTDVIVHNGANVDFVAPYASLVTANVRPIRTLCALAIASGETRTLHFVSTMAVFNALNRQEQRRIRESDRFRTPDFIFSGYAQSKWVAESACRAAASRGLPLMVHRPATIIGATTDGKVSRDDFLCRFIRGVVEMGTFPDVHLEADLVPVDWVARGVAAGVAQGLPESRTLLNVHWSTPRPILLADLMALYQERGHAIEPMPIAAWLRSIAHDLSPTNPLFALQTFLLLRPTPDAETLFEMFDGLPLDVDRSNALALLRAADLDEPDIVDACRRMADWMQHNTLPPSASPPSGFIG